MLFTVAMRRYTEPRQEAALPSLGSSDCLGGELGLEGRAGEGRAGTGRVEGGKGGRRGKGGTGLRCPKGSDWAGTGDAVNGTTWGGDKFLPG